MSAWIRLHHVLKTKQLYQAIHLLDEYHIRLKTQPDEFNGKGGCERLLHMDADATWPLYVTRKHLKKAIEILTEEQLFPVQNDAFTH